jgi:hypothetical protein
LPNKKKEKIEAEKKKKILKKLVVEKEDKRLDAIKCQFIDDTLGNEFLCHNPTLRQV